MSDGRIAWTTGLNEPSRAWWDNFFSETVVKGKMLATKSSHEPKIALQTL